MAQLYFYYSAMNAGKSTALLQSAHNYRERGMNAVIFTAKMDDRFGIGKVTSRIGIQAEAALFDPESDLFEQVSKMHDERPIDCLLLDEAQFLTRAQVDQLARIVDGKKIPVLCYGIRTDFLGELFSGSARLLAIADKLTELKTVCDCGKKATMVVRFNEDGIASSEGDQVQIGGNDTYVSMCRRHYYEALEKSATKAL